MDGSASGRGRIPFSVRPALLSVGASGGALLLGVVAGAVGPEFGYRDEEFAPIMLAGSAIMCGCFVLAWSVRAGLAWIAATAAPSTATVTAYYAVTGGKGKMKVYVSSAVLKIANKGTSAVRYQRVMWDPALHQLPHGVLAPVRIRGRGPFRRAVVDLPAGRIWPAGRLRRRPPWRAFLLPRGRHTSGSPRPQLIWVLIAAFLALQSSIGLRASLVGIMAVVSLAISGVIFWWAWTGGDIIPEALQSREAGKERPVWLTGIRDDKPYRQRNGGRGRRRKSRRRSEEPVIADPLGVQSSDGTTKWDRPD